MTVTQDYKIITLDRESVAELSLAIAAQILRAQRLAELAETVEAADEYRAREVRLMNIHAQLVLQ